MSETLNTTMPISDDPGPNEQLEASMIADLREAFGLPADERSAIIPRVEPLSSSASAAGLLAPHAAHLSSGARLGDFEIIEELGRGGMGVVYRARQISLDRTVALKVLPAHARQNPIAVQRFHTETIAASRLHHTNIVSIYAQGEDAGQLYYAMALVEGVSLDRALRDQPQLLSSVGGGSSSAARLTVAIAADPPAPETADESGATDVHWNAADFRHLARRLAEVADALDYAHTQGVLHRDIKPHNLLVDSGGRLHVTDFGLARLTDAPHLTETGEVMGTPAYLAPEQVRGDVHEIDRRADIYALGVTLYELITGRKPFVSSSRAKLLHDILSVDPPAPRRLNVRVPRDLETICLRAIEKDRERRHPAAAILAEDLRRFADGRPILSRRVSAIERSAKWTRRHKAAAIAGVALALTLLVTVGLVVVRAAGRAREARELARGVYERLAYFDLRSPDLVQDGIAQARALGTEAVELPLAESLAALGRNQPAEAADVLAARAARDTAASRDPRLLYLLACAQRQKGDLPGAAQTFATAELLRSNAAGGAPEDALPADAWFFRGLTRHFDDPVDAMESYRLANVRRARAGGFYPQALLHLARARNQQLYTLRRLDGREEAETCLKQLVEAGYYRAYPYYLLSISNRLAGEIYEGSHGTRDETAAGHFAAALEWARAGQRVDPNDDRPIAAEAECLERLGDLAAAVDARTRQLQVADADAERCEAFHYRWRLNYWLEHFDAAESDLASGLACDPNNRQYAYVFRALLRAEKGDLEGGRTLARALADSAPQSHQALIWAATTLRLLGATDEADALLAARTGQVNPALDLLPDAPEAWPQALLAAVQSGDATEAFTLIRETPRAWRLRGEIDFHLAIRMLASGERARAFSLLEEAYRSFDGERRYSYHARVILRRSQEIADWPAWLAVSSRSGQATVETTLPGNSQEGAP